MREVQGVGVTLADEAPIAVGKGEGAVHLTAGTAGERSGDMTEKVSTGGCPVAGCTRPLGHTGKHNNQGMKAKATRRSARTSPDAADDDVITIDLPRRMAATLVGSIDAEIKDAASELEAKPATGTDRIVSLSLLRSRITGALN
jgi:hypothetical protein